MADHSPADPPLTPTGARTRVLVAMSGGVDSAVAIGLPDDDMGQLVHAIVHPRAEWRDRLDTDALRDFMADRLARYKTPRTYEFVDAPLRDDAGKVRRSQLRQDRIDGAGKA